MSRSELDLAVSVRKATSPDETAPKRKHVRSCIVYSWDHKSSGAFWQALKVQPLLSDEVQTFKALICVHKILQEGHPVCLRDAQTQVSWIDSLGRSCIGDGLRGYGVLIREYSSFLLSKLKFHRQHPEFNGMLEYEEYVTLKATLDPNEGYETATNLMALQDQINSFQKLIFSHFRQSVTNECKISALVPLVQESYGIYRFVTSMLRAMFEANGVVEVLEPLEKRYIAQFHRLANFYYECSNLKYLSRLIALPKLPERPVDLRKQQDTVYLGLQPVEKTDDINEKEPPQSDPIGAVSKLNHESDKIEPFWESLQFSQTDTQESAFEPIPDMRFLAIDNNLTFPNPVSSYEANTAIPTPSTSNHNLDVIQTYENRIGELENTLNQFQSTVAATSSSVQANLDQATLRAEMWAGKYENLAQLYTRLRKEHLATIDKAKALDARMRDYSAVAQRCKSFEKVIQEKSVLLLSAEREKNAALSKLKELQNGSQKSATGISAISDVQQRYELQLREKDEEISIMKEAFEQSILELDNSAKARNMIETELLKMIETTLRTCAIHVKAASGRLTESLVNSRLKSPTHLFQVVEECAILLLHLPEVLNGVAKQLMVENCLELSHGIGSILLLSTVLGNGLASSEKPRFEEIVGDISTIAQSLFLDLSVHVTHQQSTYSVTEICNNLRDKLTDLSSLIESTQLNNGSNEVDDSSKTDVIRTAIERTEKAQALANTLQQKLGSAQYATFELSLSSKIVQLAMDITNNVAKLLDRAARTDDQVTGENSLTDSSHAYNLSGNWTNGFVSASKAIAGAISVLISVADGVLKAENDIEQLEVATQNVVSATTQLVVAARVKLTPNSPLRIDLENVAASVISSCRILNAQIRESLENTKMIKPEISMTSYELKVAEMDQQVRIVQLETALESARIKLGDLRKLSYAHASMADQ